MQRRPFFIMLTLSFLLGSSCIRSLPSTRGQPCLTDADCWDLPCQSYVCGGFTSSESPPPDQDASGDIPPIPDGEHPTEPPTETPTDPDPPCQQGQQRPCYTASKGCTGDPSGDYKCKGICQAGTQTCLSTQSWGSCKGETPPETETCDNGKDDDCNGKIDDCPCPSSCQKNVECNIKACGPRKKCRGGRCRP